jgi:hypothetical protein
MVTTPHQTFVPTFRRKEIPPLSECLNFLRVGNEVIGKNNPLMPELNQSAQRCLTRFLLGILLIEPCISLKYA